MIGVRFTSSRYHRWYNLSCPSLVKVVTSSKVPVVPYIRRGRVFSPLRSLDELGQNDLN